MGTDCQYWVEVEWLTPDIGNLDWWWVWCYPLLRIQHYGYKAGFGFSKYYCPAGN